jgi:hypothetical protein
MSGPFGAPTTYEYDSDIVMTSTTSSTNCSTGTLIVSGGVGIAENLNVCGDVVLSGTLSRSIRTETTSTTLGSDYILNMNNGSAADVTLPDITDPQYNGVSYIIIKQTANDVDVLTQAADKIFIDGVAEDNLLMDAGAGERMMVTSNGTYWYIL